jgi:DNA-binding beta-propeller fold protein YncE
MDVSPKGIGIAPDTGLLWIVDKTGRVQGIDPRNGQCEALWRMPERDLGKPVGLTVAPGPDEHGNWCDELLYVADTHYNRVMVYKPPAADRNTPEHEPTLVLRFGSYGTGPGEFRYPTDIAVTTTADGKAIDRIYVSEYGGNDRINIFDGRGAFLSSFGRFGAGRDEQPGERDVEFDRPQSISLEQVNGKTELIVVDAHNHRVGRFTPDGELICWYGGRDRPGDGPGEFRYPYGLASLGDGTVLICEFGNNRLQRIDLAAGQGLGTWGRAGRGEGELAAPWAVGILDRTAYVVDTGNNRVLAFSAPRRK